MPSGLSEDQHKLVRFLGGYRQAGQDLIVMAYNRTIPGSASGYRVQKSHSLGTIFYGHLLLLSKDKLEPVWDEVAEISGFSATGVSA